MATPFYPGRAPIDAYGSGGFRFADMSHRGSLLCLPSGILAWPYSEPEELTLAAFEPVLAECDRIEVLLLGTGESQIFLPKELRNQLNERGLFVEAMSTGAAARTYNILLAEQRAVGAALLAVK